MALAKENKDEEYCYALAKALYHDKCPLTIGLYIPWGRCKDDLLDKIRRIHLFNIIVRLLFYKPVITENHKDLKSIHFVFVRFSAWECTGSDQLWAGLVTALCDGVEHQFGLIPLSIYRALYKNKKIENRKGSEKWVSKEFLKIPLWLLTLCVFLMGVLVFALILNTVISNDKISIYFIYIFVSMFALCTVKPFIMTLEVTKNLILTQKVKVLRKLKGKDMSSQMGFMADVKKEVDTITSYLQMMEIFQNTKIRVIIEITKLDNCMPNRVVEVLNAINILLSNEDAPFISILAVDPGIIVECVEKSDLLKGMANNGYLFLNRVVTLPFSIPQMNYHTKSGHLSYIIDSKNSLRRKITEDKSRSSENNRLLEVKTGKGNKDEGANQLIREALEHLKSDECLEYITDNVINMRRIVNSIVITLRLMARDNKYQEISANKVSKWVIMAAQWPCSFSWILQCIEDEQQSRKGQDSPYEKIKLWDIYEMSLDTLHANRESLKELLELDGDPDTFCKLLEYTDFTVEDANKLRTYTVNLDHTIQRKIELLQGSFELFEVKKEKSLTRMNLLKMSTSQVCDKMKELNLKHCEDYIEKIEKHNLDGKALLYSKNEEIRGALGMNLGDWVIFRAKFLSLPTPNLFF
ncbi:LOW QUALITY PROTEIN: NTPase KAP family P-loop domain-containing protein 1-like [Bufo gargarizans]|uniref:LOW QUALITY PROTEIN: NTPase KAP family P-loop domain-containing protein 1-like n=1 Tax=Bufo gargarizans TaxID=30331 RepID=UPI001CF17DBD|nr:LOW QUALITY PROTEIN: NTPase KAP family P-loop domain-containing protein 1-like [Bufo gargarizans]